mgnify:CR=1 FL=1
MPAPDRNGSILLHGADAPAFVQAQFSNDIGTLVPGTWQFGAWLNAQGRVRAFFQLVRLGDEAFLLLLRGGNAADIAAALRRYVLRARVTVEIASGTLYGEVLQDGSVYSLAGTIFDVVCDDAGLHLLLPGTPALEWRFERHDDAVDTPSVDARTPEFRAAEILAGLPQLPETQLERLLPAWLGLERLGAVSHSKGCYPGQEIVARLHFRGGEIRRGLYRLRLHGLSPPAAGSTLRDERGSEAGVLLQVVPAPGAVHEALAVLRDGVTTEGIHVENAPSDRLEIVAMQWSHYV